ncbi:serine/threonine-protein kinase [Candidatus Uabimicrobium sp. HlEnr_7]|uniref:serine/threonine-protein kinase n=1 Tax=Candidatus Uabimicrobium helgolandensis TaxID=3095367 RepID=UPI0035592E6E
MNVVFLESNLVCIKWQEKTNEDDLELCFSNLKNQERYYVVCDFEVCNYISPQILKKWLDYKEFNCAKNGDVKFCANENIKNIFRFAGCYEEQMFVKDVYQFQKNLQKRPYLPTIKKQKNALYTSTVHNLSKSKIENKTINSNRQDSSLQHTTILEDPPQQIWQTIVDIKNTYKGERHLSSSKLDDSVHNEALSANCESNEPRISFYEEIARGGMGIVLRGSQNSLQREVAVKKLLRKKGKKLFVSESMITAYLDHPNIIPVYDFVQQDEEVLLAMKLVKGKSWDEFIRQNSLQDNLHVLLQVCNAIAFAHSKEIIHCDLKPENIMIGEFGEVTVMDWGLAVSMSPSIIASHKDTITAPMGTPAYFSRELANGEGQKIGPWTDTYLLGGILYEILCGEAPHNKETTIMAFRSATCGELPEFPVNVSRELKDICCKALCGDEKKRYVDVRDFQKDVHNFLKHCESILLSDQSQKVLRDCREEKYNEFTYDNLSKAYFGFQQALELWQENTTAKQGIIDSSVAYAKTAIDRADFSLAELQLKKLNQDHEQVQKLKKEIQIAQNFKKGHDVSKSLFKLNLFFLLLVCIRFTMVHTLPVTIDDQVALQIPLTVKGSIIIFFCTFFYLFKNKNFNEKTIIYTAMVYEIIGSFLMVIGLFFIKIEANIASLGIFPSIIWILFINMLVPYNWWQCLFCKVCILSALLFSTIVGHYLSNLPPSEILANLFFQTGIVSTVCIFVAAQKGKKLGRTVL